jgi:hypothetical protein
LGKFLPILAELSFGRLLFDGLGLIGFGVGYGIGLVKVD